MIVFSRTIFAAVLLPILVSSFISFFSLSAFAQVVQQTPQVAPDKPAESAPIAPSVALPTIEKIGASKVEPPAAANSALVITPAQEAAEILASGKFLAPLIPEGGFLVRASGTLGRDEFFGVWTFELDGRVDGATDRSLILLPAEPLADMIQRHVSTIKDGTSAPMFEISGQVLVFHKRNFLLPTFAVPVDRRVERPAVPKLLPPGSKGALELAQNRSVVATAETAAVAAAGTTAATDVTLVTDTKNVDPEKFATDLESRLNERVAVVPSSADNAAPAIAAAPGTPQSSRTVASATDLTASVMPMIEARTAPLSSATHSALPLLPPMRVQSRRGTITRDPLTGTWRFIFASGQRDNGDIALELLPCGMLNQLIASARSSDGASHVMLTGDVTVFEGRNYLRPIRSQPLGAGKWIGP
ncbi:MAG: hypothetical protein RL692_511 [Planctomycetota bacterium]